VWVQTPPPASFLNIPHLLHHFLIFYAELIWKKYRDFFVKRWREMTVETGALSIVENFE
jgi:hypothetical protein